jgi:hypothetical protein
MLYALMYVRSSGGTNNMNCDGAFVTEVNYALLVLMYKMLLMHIQPELIPSIQINYN